MWRFESTHEKSETEYLDQVVERIRADKDLYLRAENMLDSASQAEPLFMDSLRAPQDVRYHAEGPFVRNHLREMLMALYAIVEGKVHLIDIEEFRRLKGYEGEIDELEEIIKEQAALFEVFVLVHDIAKWSTIRFVSREHSRGEERGFMMDENQYAHQAHSTRVELRERYLELYRDFESQHPGHSAQEIQRDFYLTYEIDVKYPHHARQIHTPVFEALLERFAQAHDLPGRDLDLLEDLITHHMEFNKDFLKVRPERMRRYHHLARVRGWDSDDFIDIMQGCILLDMVFGSLKLSPHGYWHDAAPILNCLESEHQYIPMRRAEKLRQLEMKEKSSRNNVFKDVGLDGMAVMDLLGMEAGPEFGKTLRRIHSGVIGKGDMPKFGKTVDQEIERRALAYYKKTFVKGE
jgi:hypothetical protein